ncbi:MAG: sensor histidine kinase [Bacteroidia bacterium]|nr:sensor histidine kinase [Bacteroidia bacterium]
MSLTSQRTKVILLHASFWCVYLSIFLYQVSSYQRGRDMDWGRILIIVSTQVLFAAFLSYINYFTFLPRLLAKSDKWKYLILFLLFFAVVITLRIYLERNILNVSENREGYLYSPRFVVQVVTSNLFIVIFVGMLRFAEDWFEFEARKKEIEHEKLAAELNFLKAQINPHFLFNTLNNLYYLAYTKSDNTTEVIAKLSQMMRYMIYDSNHPKVLLGKEIEYMQNYISLERLRLNNQIPITFDIEGEVDNRWIAPLIFITFLENAFKHGVNNSNPKAWVNVRINIAGNECVYTVENSKPEKADVHEKSGIGLRNVERRLELSYPGRYKLTSEDKKDVYLVQLTLTLS